MLYDWIQEFTGIVQNSSGTYQNSNIQATACIIMIMIIMYLLFLVHYVIQRIFHLR